MIRASLIYAAVTFLLALIDAIRARIAKKKGQANIDHKISTELAAITGIIVVAICIWGDERFGFEWVYKFLVIEVGLLFVRLVFYDPALNLCRRLPINYQSNTTSSWFDSHSLKLEFWEKRAIGIVAWGIVVIVYYKIF